MYQPSDQDERAAEGLEQTDEPAGAANADVAPAPAKPELTASFLAEISRAMRAAAVQERDRIAATVADSTVAHEQKVRDRGAAEATELRRNADEDIAGIERTSAEEIERIQAEAERRIGERRSELTDHLERHATLVETEVGRIRGAVDDYSAELDGFFGRLAEEQNPAEIARLAALLPEPPDMDQVGAMARADAVAEIADEPADAEPAADSGDAGDAGVGVMADDAGTPVMSDATTAEDEPAPAPEPVPAGAMADDAAAADAGDAEAPRSGMSAATLLRNLAPWTNPDRSSDNGQD
jgi:hypothetical protein